MSEYDDYENEVWKDAGVDVDELKQRLDDCEREKNRAIEAIKDQTTLLDRYQQNERRLIEQLQNMEERNRELVKALEWIKDASDVSTNRCHCGRPTGVLALHSHAKRALAQSKHGRISNMASREDIDGAKAWAYIVQAMVIPNDEGVVFEWKQEDVKMVSILDKALTDRERERGRLHDAVYAAINGAGKHDRGYIITEAAMQALRTAALNATEMDGSYENIKEREEQNDET